MRILHFGRFWSDNPGGVERHVDVLLTQLALRGVDCVNLVANDKNQTERIAHHGYRVVKAASYGEKFRTALAPALLLQMRKLLHEQTFDLVHAHFPDPLTHLALALLPRSMPKVLTWHSDLVPYPALQKIYQPLVNRTLRAAQAIVAATPVHLQTPQIPADIPAARKHVIPYGMDFGSFAATPEVLALAGHIRQTQAGKPIVFALGRHVAYKGFEVLIQAMQDLPQAQLVLGGTGPLLTAHQQLAQSLGLADRVHFAGRIADADLPAWYHACSVYCFPSVGKTEAFGLVQLEAMACAKPVVCSYLGNGVNYISQDGKTGLAVPPGDSVALAKALNQVLSDTALAERLGAYGRQRALAEYSLEAMSVQTLKLYQTLLA